jgi:hypothetical protein
MSFATGCRIDELRREQTHGQALSSLAEDAERRSAATFLLNEEIGSEEDLETGGGEMLVVRECLCNP